MRISDWSSDVCSSDLHAEVQKWSERYISVGTRTWVTSHVDVEAYFCQPTYLSALYGVELDTAQAWVEEAVALVKDRKRSFFEKRKVINRVLYEHGGSPASEQLDRKSVV